MIRVDFSGCLTASETIRVPFNDIDVTGVVWHGRYFKYFEAVRHTLFDTIGYSYQEMVSSGYIWPIADTMVRFVRPLTLNLEVDVIACLREWEMRLVVDYKVQDDGGTIYTKARTIQVPLDAASRELRFGCPQILIDRVARRLSDLS